MNSDVTARRYAEAIYGIGQSTGKLAVFQSNAENFLKVLESSKELMTALSHPNIRRGQRRAIIDEVLKQSGYDRVFSNFIRLVVERGRILYFPKMVSSLVSLRDESEGRLRGIVYSATALSAAQRSNLRSKVQKTLGHDVVLEERIDADLIGGLRVEIDGRIYDSSVRRQLEKMRESILSGVR